MVFKSSLSRSGFTLIETLIAITFVMTVFTAVTGLVLITNRASQHNLRRYQAVLLAQEGLEVMRYLRDSNWLQNLNWTGIAADDFGLDGENERLLYLSYERAQCPPCWKFLGDGKVALEDGFEFTRQIEVRPVVHPQDVSQVREDTLEVTARIMWNTSGRDSELSLSTYLSDWK